MEDQYNNNRLITLQASGKFSPVPKHQTFLNSALEAGNWLEKRTPRPAPTG